VYGIICLQSYFYNDDLFNFNYAQAKAAVGNFKEAEEVSFIALLLMFLKIQSFCSFSFLIVVYRNYKNKLFHWLQNFAYILLRSKWQKEKYVCNINLEA